MSKPNKANKSNYDQAGRLTPDDLAREQKKQAKTSSRTGANERVTAKVREQAGSRPRSAPEE